MLLDLALTNTGDILFQEKDENNQPQKIIFNYSKTCSQKISFNIYDVESTKHDSNNYLKVDFFIDKNNPKSMAVTYSDSEAKAQLITLKLKTCLGELPERSNFGSKLSSFRHQNINDTNLKSLEKYLESILSNDISNVSVKADVYIDYNNGYKQTVNLSIFSDDSILLQYKIER